VSQGVAAEVDGVADVLVDDSGGDKLSPINLVSDNNDGKYQVETTLASLTATPP
jgi:hypothetical protein